MFVFVLLHLFDSPGVTAAFEFGFDPHPHHLFNPTKIADEMKKGKMEETAKKRSELILANIKKAQGDLDNKNTAERKNNNFDDSQWPAMKLPGVW